MRYGKSVLAIIAVVALALVSVIVAGSDTTTLSIEAPAEVAQASEFTARMAVDHVQDFNSCNFDVTYDPAVITVTAVTGGEIDGHSVAVGSGDWTYMPPGSQDTGRIRVIATVPGVPGPGVTGAGYVAEIHFKVAGGGGDVSDIAISGVAMYDYQATAIATTTVDGSVTVAGTATDLEITTASPLPTGNADQGYSKTLAAAGGTPPYSWTASGLPDGLTCSTAGAISGTPTQSGDFSVTVTVTDSAAASKSKDLGLRVEAIATPEITTTELPDGQLGQAYTAELEAAGGAAPYTWTASGLPAGVSCSAQGVLAGTPTEAGDFEVTVIATDSSAVSDSKTLQLRVQGPLELTTTELADGETGQAYSAALAAAGGTTPYTWTATGLPGGLTCSSSGVISGTLAQAGDFSVTVTVTDAAAASESKVLPLKIYPALEITTTVLVGGKVGDAYSATLTGSGGKQPVSWSATGLPTGLSCSGVGVISGTPSGEAGTFTVTITAASALGNTSSKSLTLVIDCRPGDVNMDGGVDDQDVERVAGIYFEIAPPTPCADVNGDGRIDAGDITAIRRIYFGVSTTA